MTLQTRTGLPFARPTSADIQRRWAELHGYPLDHQPHNQQQDQPRPSPAAPPPLPDSGLPKLPVAALHGYATPVIALPHLQAALAVWDYCYASATLLFGRSTGDPIADRIREAIDAAGGALSKSQIVRLFHGHIESARIDVALEALVALGALDTQSEPTGGRPCTRWAAIAADQHQENEDSLAEDEEAVEAH
jgi:hypothetical protein